MSTLIDTARTANPPGDSPGSHGEGSAGLASTGIPALDARIGGLVRNRHYLLEGEPGTGKSSATLQFVGHGLAMGERALILTQDDPADLLAQAEFLGYDFRTPAEQDQLAILQYRLDFIRNFTRAADPAIALHEFRRHIAEHRPDRVAVDSMSPFLEGGRATEDALSSFPEFLELLDCTTYLVVPGALSESSRSRIYDRVIASAGGIFQFAVADAPVRRLTIRKLRHPVRSSEPLSFVLKPGSGIVEHEPARRPDDLPAALGRRVIVLRCSSALSDDIVVALENTYDLVRFDAVEPAFAELVGGRHGALIIALEPRDSDRVFQLVREVRRSGNGAPILFVSPQAGLRGSTRARGLRAGGDDFLTDALSPEEFVERIEVARQRGHRRPQAEVELEPLFIQPVAPDGGFILLEASELRAVVRDKLASSSHPFFALVRFPPTPMEPAAAWSDLCSSLRVTEGDLGACLPDGGLAVYLHDVRRRHVEQLLKRITTRHPEFGPVDRCEVFCYPTDRREVQAWVAESASAPVPA